MCQFETPSLLFYAYIPVLIISLLLGFYILFANKKSPINRNLFVFILLFCFWIKITLLTWITKDPKLNLFLERISLIEVFALYFFHNFVQSFIGQSLSKKRKIILAIPFLPIVILMFTDLNFYSVSTINCQNQSGDLYWYVYIVALFYAFYSIYKLLEKYKKSVDDNNIRRQIKIIVYSIIFFVLWFLFFVLLRYILVLNGVEWGDNVYLLIPMGMVVFIGMIIYAITRYKFLNLKLLTAQALMIALIVLVGSKLFFAENMVSRILTLLTFILSVVFGYMLIKSVKAEAQRKEELQAMSDRLALANDQLRKLDSAKTEFISIASHQLRTPLTIIKGFVSMILEGAYGEISPKVRETLNKIYLSNERMVQLVENLLNISRIESGRLEYQYRKWKVEEIIDELYDSFFLIAKNKGLTLEIKKPAEPLPEVEIDGLKTREVISNLIDNAIKYTNKGGIIIDMRVVDSRPTVQNEFQTPNVADYPTEKIKYVRISVIDTGVGVSKTELPYLFSKFSRGKDTARLHVGGTGLGLFVGKQMIEAQQGRLWVESEGKGMGSRFILEIPVSQKKRNNSASDNTQEKSVKT